jgi:hypothetical protein
MATPEEAVFPFLLGHRQVVNRTYRHLFLALDLILDGLFLWLF